MRRAIVFVGAVAALAVIVAIAWTAPTVVVAAPLWIMALCVLTGCRSAPSTQAVAGHDSSEASPIVLSARRIDRAGRRHAAS